MELEEVNYRRAHMGLPPQETLPGPSGAEDLHQLSKWTLFPSTRAVLEAGFSCRETPKGKGWAIYWMEFGAELTLFPGDEGPQEANDIDEIIEWIGGDQRCYLTPASLKRLGVSNAAQTNRGATSQA